MLILKIIILISLGLILYQDTKERQVYWFLFPVLGISSAILFYNATLPELFYISLGMNLVFIFILLLCVYLYAKLKLRSNFNEALGFGDILLFIGLAFSFSTISFLVIFVFSLLFSLILHLLVKRHFKLQSVPLAGYISLFFGIAYIAHWSGIVSSLYIL